MNCQEVVEYMHRYLDQDLDPEETAQMYRHVAVCSACAEKFNILKSLSRDLEELPHVTPPFSLVDAILPKLEAIDRGETEQMKAVKDYSPSVMVPELNRKGRKTNWWNSIPGRTVMGTAAAAFILGVAIFTYKPEVLSNAEMPFQEETGIPASNGSGMDEAANTLKKQDNNSVNNNSGIVDENDKETFKASEEPEEVPDMAASDEMRSSGEKAGNAEGAPEQNGTHHKFQAKDMPNPADTGSTNRNTEKPKRSPKADDSVPPQQSQNQLVVPPKDPAAGSQESKMPSDNKEAELNKPDTATGFMDLRGISRMGPPQWVSPNTLYSASLEIDKLIIYRLSINVGQLPEMITSLPLEGEWAGGEWSSDSKVFRYTVLVDQKEIKREFILDQPVEAVEPPVGEKNNVEAEPTEPVANP